MVFVDDFFLLITIVAIVRIKIKNMHIEMAIFIFEHFILISSNMIIQTYSVGFCTFFTSLIIFFYFWSQSVSQNHFEGSRDTRYAFGEVIRVCLHCIHSFTFACWSPTSTYSLWILVKWLIENPCGSSQNIIYACLVTAWLVVSAYFIIQKVPIDQTIRKQI